MRIIPFARVLPGLFLLKGIKEKGQTTILMQFGIHGRLRFGTQVGAVERIMSQ